MDDLGLAPLRRMAFGLVIVLVDIRINGIDLVPDPIGWLLVVLAAARLLHRHPAFAWSMGAGVLGFLVSLPGAVGVEAGSLLEVLDLVTSTVHVVATCTAIAALSARHRRFASRLRWWDLGLALPALLLAVVHPDPAQVWGGLIPLAALWALAGLVVVICFLVLLFRAADEEPVPAQPTRP